MTQKTNNFSALITLITVFFFWGFIAASNGVFIPFCKDFFKLSQFQSQLIDSAFYGAYYFGALFIYLYSSRKRIDLINSWGYKKSIIFGLIISAIGAILMIPAIYTGSFSFILISLFILAIGFCLQQTSANPFTISLGPPETGSHRLNLAGGINSLGTTIGPIVLSIILFGGIMNTTADIKNMNILYLFVALLFLLLAYFLKKSKNLPNTQNHSIVSSSPKASKLLTKLTIIIILISSISLINNVQQSDILSTLTLFILLLLIILTLSRPLFIKNKKSQEWGAMKYPQLILGMIAIFCYVYCADVGTRR